MSGYVDRALLGNIDRHIAELTKRVRQLEQRPIPDPRSDLVLPVAAGGGPGGEPCPDCEFGPVWEWTITSFLNGTESNVTETTGYDIAPIGLLQNGGPEVELSDPLSFGFDVVTFVPPGIWLVEGAIRVVGESDTELRWEPYGAVFNPGFTSYQLASWTTPAEPSPGAIDVNTPLTPTAFTATSGQILSLTVTPTLLDGSGGNITADFYLSGTLKVTKVI